MSNKPPADTLVLAIEKGSFAKLKWCSVMPCMTGMKALCP